MLHNLVEASFDLFSYLLLCYQLKPWELHPLVPYTSYSRKKINGKQGILAPVPVRYAEEMPVYSFNTFFASDFGKKSMAYLEVGAALYCRREVADGHCDWD